MEMQKIGGEEFRLWADEGRFLAIAWVERDSNSARLNEFVAIGESDCPEVSLAQITFDEAQDTAAMFAIDTAPALLVMHEKVVLYCEPGLPEPEVFQRLITRAAGLNMTAIHKEIEIEKEAEIALRMRRVCPTARRRK